jgi:hypothetical protein
MCYSSDHAQDKADAEEDLSNAERANFRSDPGLVRGKTQLQVSNQLGQ